MNECQYFDTHKLSLMERIGLRTMCGRLFLNNELLIKDTLLFDKIILHNQSVMPITSAFKLHAQYKRKVEEANKKIDELLENGLIEMFEPKNFDKYDDEIEDIGFETVGVINTYTETISKLDTSKPDTVDVILDIDAEVTDYNTRLWALRYSDAECTPLLMTNLMSKSKSEQNRQDTLSVILNNIPTISSDISISQLREFKADQDAKDKFLALRNFMITLSKESLTEFEMHERVEYLLNEYKQQLKLHKAKLEHSTLETILITTAEVLENIAQLKFSTALKAMLDVDKKHIELLEAERNFVGREVAYIHKIKTDLGDTK